jgi:TetR/AcrR family transcriptional regulator, regulator of cefoperazone and chloramphenicol sensitivity
VAATVRRFADKNNKEFWFVRKEFASPTGLLEEAMRKEIYPLQKRMEALVRELLGPIVSDMQVQFCETSIISQCINPMVIGKKSKGKNTKKGGSREIKDIEAYADHVVKFSLAGMRSIRENAESRTSHAKRGKDKNGRINEVPT